MLTLVTPSMCQSDKSNMEAQSQKRKMSKKNQMTFFSDMSADIESIKNSSSMQSSRSSEINKSNENTKNTMKDSRSVLDEVCRACLAHSDRLQSLFYVQDNSTSLLNMFISCTSLKISFGDRYSKYICQNCVDDLFKAFEFWTKCHNSIRELDRIANELDGKNNTDLKSELKQSMTDYETISTTDDNHVAEVEQKKATEDIVPKRYKPIKPKLIRFKSLILSKRPNSMKRTTLIKISAKDGSKKMKHKCIFCEQTFSTSRLLIQHKKTHKSKPSERTRKCHRCKLQFDTKEDYNQHTKTHNTFLCQLCGHISKSRSGFNAHKASHSSLQPFACETCGRKYKSISSLQVHMRNHTGERRYTCEHCDKKFITWNSMKSHIRTHHTTERPYVCQVCSKTFKQSGTLNIHMRQHTGEKPYQCTECTMAFRSGGDLKCHMVKHTGERKYSCTLCGKLFARPYNLTQHMVTHTGERKHKCKICEKAFTQAHVLRGHLKTHGIIATTNSSTNLNQNQSQ